MLRLLFCHLAFQVNLCFDQLIYKLSEQVFSYYKHLAGSIYLDKALQWLCKKNNFQVTSPPPGRYHSLLKQTQVKVNCWNLHTRVVLYCTELSGLSGLSDLLPSVITRKRWKGDQIRVCSLLTLKSPFTPSFKVNAATTLQWHWRYCSHWKQWSHLRMELQPIFERLHCFQWEQYY